MGRDLRGRASFTRSTVTDTVARLSRPLDRLSLSLFSTCTYMYIYMCIEYIYIYSSTLFEVCITPSLSWHEIRLCLMTPGRMVIARGSRRGKISFFLAFCAPSTRCQCTLYTVAVIRGGGGVNWKWWWNGQNLALRNRSAIVGLNEKDDPSNESSERLRKGKLS